MSFNTTAQGLLSQRAMAEFGQELSMAVHASMSGLGR